MLVVDLVTDVLRDLAIISEIATPSAEQGQQAVTKLNDLMASLAEDGITFGYNPKATTADSIVLPDGQVATIKALLGVALADSYGLPSVPLNMATVASTGYERLMRQSLNASMRNKVTDAPMGDRQPYRWNILTGAP